MGYTNYWTPTNSFTKKQRMAMVDFTEKAIKLSGVKICGLDGTGKPELTGKRIGFNGCEADGHDHESFILLADNDWNFCKTARKPYDVVVKACLLYGEEIGIIRDWAFDGDKSESEYLDGVKLYEAAMLAPTKDKGELTQEDYDEMRERLTNHTVENMDDRTLADIIAEGCPGHNNMEDDDILELFIDTFGEDEIVELQNELRIVSLKG